MTEVSAFRLTGVIERIFFALGFSSAAARTVAWSLVDADLRGVTSLGTMLVPIYVERIRRGSVSRAESAEVLHDFGAVATLDAHHGLGQLTGDHAMRIAIDKARTYGIGAVAVRHAFHFGAAFRYARLAADIGLIGIATANTHPMMPAPGGERPVVGTNPLAIAVPLPGGPPIVLDMSMSETGRPDTPIGGPKGYGLALMIDVLTGVLSGGAFGSDVRCLYGDATVPYNCAHFFLALDPAAFGDITAFSQRALHLADEVESSPTQPGVYRVFLPGQLEQERAETAFQSGIELDAHVLAGLCETAASLGVDPGMPA